MDPEYELAIKISEYFEFLWDGRVPVWLLPNSSVTLAFPALIPLDLNQRDAEDASSLIAAAVEQGSFRAAVLASDYIAVTDAIRQFLESREQRKPRLRRAAKCAGLWIRLKREFDEGQFPDRYVPPLERETDRLPSGSREFRTEVPGNEEKVLEDITEQCSGAIAFDLIAVAEALKHHPFAGLVSDDAAKPREHEPIQGSVSVASLQYDLTSHFFRFPSHMSEIAEVLRFIPSFTARVADAVLSAAPKPRTSWIRRMLDEKLYAAADAFFRGHDRPPMDVRVGAALRRKRMANTADLVEGIVYEIDRTALEGHKRPARIERMASAEVNASFAISLYLLEKKKWCVMIADMFHIPVPFGVLLAEELDQVDQSRAMRYPLAELRNG